GHAAHRRSHDGHAGARRDRHRRAADHLDVRRHRQRGVQRPGRARAQRAVHARARPRRPGHQTRGEPLMKNFTYFRPASAEQAVGLLENRWGTTELLAGGTDLLSLQKDYIAQPNRVVSLGAVNALAGVTRSDRGVTIGARTTLTEIADNAELRRA